MQEPIINPQRLKQSLLVEVKAMVEFCLSRGKAVPPSIIADFERINTANEVLDEDLEKFVNYHQILARRILPAQPRNVLYLHMREKALEGKSSFWQFKFPSLRNIIVFSLASIIMLILSGTSSYVDPEILAEGILNSNGYPLFINFVFLCSAAGIGSSFFILSNIKSRFTDGTYHPDQDVQDWIVIILGVIGGIILSQLVPINITSIEKTEYLFHINRGVFALLGGFSSKFIYGILNKFINTFQSLFNNEDELESMKTLHAQKEAAVEELNQMKLNVTKKVFLIKDEIHALGIPENSQQNLNKALESMGSTIGMEE